MIVRIQFRRGTTAEWAEANPILGGAEPGFDTTLMQLKFGDAVTHWSDLEWATFSGEQMQQLAALLEAGTSVNDGIMTAVLVDDGSEFTEELLGLIGATSIPLTQKGADSGVAALDSDGLLLEGNMPTRLTPGGLETTIGDEIDTDDTPARIAAISLVKQRRGDNLADYGVDPASGANQGPAINAALGWNPEKHFTIPPGDYRSDIMIDCDQANTVEVLKGAHIYAGATMDTLVSYDNGAASLSGYAQDKGFFGHGLIDGALKASTALYINKVLRHTLDDLTIVDPVHRGIVTGPDGAEIFANNIRLHNTGTTNASDNIGIESTMGDCHWTDIVTRDFTVGIKATRGGKFTRCHPWLGLSSQIAARWANSIAFDLGGTCIMEGSIPDTYRKAFKIGLSASGGASVVLIKGSHLEWSTSNLTEADAIAARPLVLDITTGNFVDFDHNVMIGPSGWAAGNRPLFQTNGEGNKLFNAFDNMHNDLVAGVAEYKRGVKMNNTNGYGTTPFSPTVYGSTTAGTTTYTTQSGSMEVRDGMAFYRFRVEGSFGSAAAGKVRLGGFPYVPGAASVSTGHGGLDCSVGVGTAVGVLGANGTSGPTVAIPRTLDGTEVNVTASGAFVMHGSIECPFNFPT